MFKIIQCDGKHVLAKSISSNKRYFATTEGHIWDSRREIFLQQKERNDRYKIVSIGLVHRLVALAFLKKPKGKNIVMHIDNNKGNNHVLNLKWGTPAENLDYIWRVQHQKSTLKLHPVTLDVLGWYPSINAAYESVRKEPITSHRGSGNISFAIKHQVARYDYRWAFEDAFLEQANAS